MKKNLLLEKLKNKQPVTGCSLTVPSPQMVEMLASAGFDWVLIDMEHGAVSIETLELMAMAAEACGITAIGRPGRNDPQEIAHIMDRGVSGVQIPYVNNFEDAFNAVNAVKFGSGTARGMSVGIRANNYGQVADQVEFTKFSNENSLVCVQIETEEAIQNIDQILEVDGIDVFFIGPMDLSQSMGYPGNPRAPEVVEAMVRTLHKIVLAGKIPGMPVSKENAAAVVNHGVLYLHTYLSQVVDNGCEDLMNAIKTKSDAVLK